MSKPCTTLGAGEIIAVLDVDRYELFVSFCGENEGDAPTVLRITSTRGVPLLPSEREALERRIEKLEVIHR